MQKKTVTVIIVFLLFCIGFYVQGRMFSSEKKAIAEIEHAIIEWDTKTNPMYISMQNTKQGGLRDVQESLRNKLRIFVVDGALLHNEILHPKFLGNGMFSFMPTLQNPQTMFLFLEDQQTRTYISKQVQAPQLKKIEMHAILTKEIGPYKTSLVFTTLKPNREENLQFVFETKELLTFGEQTRLFIVDEKQEYFTTVVPTETKEHHTLTFATTFPTEGPYKIWAVFQINGKEYKQTFTIQVAKQ